MACACACAWQALVPVRCPSLPLTRVLRRFRHFSGMAPMQGSVLVLVSVLGVLGNVLGGEGNMGRSVPNASLLRPLRPTCPPAAGLQRDLALPDCGGRLGGATACGCASGRGRPACGWLVALRVDFSNNRAGVAASGPRVEDAHILWSRMGTAEQTFAPAYKVQAKRRRRHHRLRSKHIAYEACMHTT